MFTYFLVKLYRNCLSCFTSCRFCYRQGINFYSSGFSSSSSDAQKSTPKKRLGEVSAASRAVEKRERERAKKKKNQVGKHVSHLIEKKQISSKITQNTTTKKIITHHNFSLATSPCHICQDEQDPGTP